MDTDRIVGSAKEYAGRAEGAVGDMAGDAKTQASGKTREAAGTRSPFARPRPSRPPGVDSMDQSFTLELLERGSRRT